MLKRLGRMRRRLSAPGNPAVGSVVDDTQAFLSVARQSFLQMQAAWDRADLPALEVMTSASLLHELREQLALRGPVCNRTEVLELHARLVALDDLQEALVASVEFSGMIREQVDRAAAPFRELWLLANVKAAGRGWQLARVQSLS